MGFMEHPKRCYENSSSMEFRKITHVIPIRFVPFYFFLARSSVHASRRIAPRIDPTAANVPHRIVVLANIADGSSRKMYFSFILTLGYCFKITYKFMAKLKLSQTDVCETSSIYAW